MPDKTAHPDHPVHELLARRWSPYAFSTRPVERADLRSLFEAARWAASSYNEQPWHYLVATRDDEDAFARLLSCLVEGNQAWAKHAPVLALAVVRRRFTRNGKPNRAAEHDLGLALGNLMLEATARGLFVHAMIGIEPERARERYAIPEDCEALTAIAIGHLADAGERAELPDELVERDRGERTRRPLEAFVFAGRFGRAADLAG